MQLKTISFQKDILWEAVYIEILNPALLAVPTFKT